MDKEINQPTLEELCKYFWELAKKYALTEQGKKEIASVEFCLKSEMIMNKVGTIEESEKAFKIIVEKKVNIYAVLSSHSLNNYHLFMNSYESDFLSEEEYNLVKKVVDKYDKK